ncbi:retrovirus-related pol polyprotein from transposon TNT 1-94 [Tanacetum coccineum]
MAQNKVWDLVNLPEGSKRVGCKWVFKIERDSKGNVKRYKARLVAKGYTQNNDVDYNETFSLVSKKDSLRVILALMTHYDLKPHQMDVKTAFLNENIEEEVYMEQPEGFFIDVSKGLLGLSQKAYIDKILERSSIMEAEFVACYEATIHALWLRNFISGLGVVDTISKPLKMYCDNTATIFLYKNDKYSKGAKHMDIKFFIVKEEI